MTATIPDALPATRPAACVAPAAVCALLTRAITSPPHSRVAVRPCPAVGFGASGTATMPLRRRFPPPRPYNVFSRFRAIIAFRRVLLAIALDPAHTPATPPLPGRAPPAQVPIDPRAVCVRSSRSRSSRLAPACPRVHLEVQLIDEALPRTRRAAPPDIPALPDRRRCTRNCVSPQRVYCRTVARVKR